MAKCNRDCFNCIEKDCVLPDNYVSHEERKEIRQRDKMVFTPTVTLPRSRYSKAKHRYSR